MTTTEITTCTICDDEGMVTCPPEVHMVETDEDGWCANCDSPDEPARVMCECMN